MSDYVIQRTIEAIELQMRSGQKVFVMADMKP